MPRIQDSLLYERVVEDVKQRVSARRLKAGDRLPSIMDMCRIYKVSAITARRAVHELKAAGLVSTFNGRGIFVKGAPNVDLIARASQDAIDPVSRLVVISSNAQSLNAPGTFMARVWEGISHAAHERGLPVSTEFVPVDLTSVPHVPFTPESGQGIVVLGAVVSPFVLALLANPSVPSVLVDAGCMGTCCVVTDNFSGIRQALAHLKGLGHEHVAFSGNFSMGWNTTNENERREAFVRLAGDFGMQSHVVSGREWDRFFDQMKEPTAPTALLFSRDECALDFLRLARRRGLRTPEDISVVGFDGFFPDVKQEGLTTVEVDRDKLGRAAIQRLLGFAEQPDSRCLWTRIEPQLVARASTGRPRRL